MKFNSFEDLGHKMKPFGNQEEKIESLENLTMKDFTPESFSLYFPLVMANSHAYKLWSGELANVINKSSISLI